MPWWTILLHLLTAALGTFQHLLRYNVMSAVGSIATESKNLDIEKPLALDRRGFAPRKERTLMLLGGVKSSSPPPRPPTMPPGRRPAVSVSGSRRLSPGARCARRNRGCDSGQMFRRTASAWVESGTSCGRRIFVRPPGIFQVEHGQTISERRIKRTSPGLAIVRAVSCSAARTVGQPSYSWTAVMSAPSLRSSVMAAQGLTTGAVSAPRRA